MKIYIGSDHAGFQMKEKIREWLSEMGHDVEDMGAFKLNPLDDYNDFILPVAEAVSSEDDSMGIVLGGSGTGEAILSNRLNWVRCVSYYGGNIKIVSLAREHNDANMLSLGARFISLHRAKKAIKVFLNTEFSENEKYKRRIDKMDKK